MTVELLRRADVLDLLERGDRHPRKALGQNFVVDPGTIRRIVELAGVRDGDQVLEIGPGLGSLTLGLVAAGAKVTCIEKDADMVGLLDRTLAERAPGVEVVVHHADALGIDLAELTRSETPDPSTWRLVANLPYNVATQIVLRALEEAPAITSMLVMVQREVAHRLAAGPGSKVHGIPSVLLALRATARVAGTIPAEVFYPRPRVASALVEVRRLAEPLVDDAQAIVVGDLVRRGFGQRRKMLRGSLDLSDDTFRRAGIDGDARPETLGVEAWCRLAEALAS